MVDFSTGRKHIYLPFKRESYMKNTNGRHLTQAEKQNMSDLDGMVIRCMFKNEPFNSKDDFITSFASYYMNCIRFNSGLDSSGRPINPKKVFSSDDELIIEFYFGLPKEITSFYPK